MTRFRRWRVASWPPLSGQAVTRRFGAQRILLDCRWLGIGGSGRATELLLAHLAALRPDGRWILWGRPERLQPMVFDDAVVEASYSDPRSLFGQRDVLRIPDHDVAVFMNQIRPLRSRNAVMIVHDTIPLRYGGVLPVRMAKYVYFVVASRFASVLLTVSSFSRDRIARDLHIPADRIDVLAYPVDEERAAEIRALRRRLRRAQRLLYVGQFRRHKNLRRLALAFAASGFARRGGRLLLVGGEQHDTAHLRAWMTRTGLTGIDARSVCSEHELQDLMATSCALIVPSLEEGYGLPAFEAAASGIPVAVSRTGAMTELPAASTVFFDPLEVEDIRRAIDDVVAREDAPPFFPTDGMFASVVLDAVESALSGNGGGS